MRPLHKYLLLQLPGWLVAAVVLALLAEWRAVSAGVAAGLFLLWIVKDVLLYPLLSDSYRSDVPTGSARLIGRSARARDGLNPTGWVQVEGELWRAEVASGNPPVGARAPVRIVGARRMTLIVEPESVDERV